LSSRDNWREFPAESVPDLRQPLADRRARFSAGGRMDVTATVNSDNNTLQTQGVPAIGTPNPSSPDAALFAALMASSTGGTAAVPAAPAAGLGAQGSGSQAAALMGELTAAMPIRFTVTPNSNTPNDSALEDFAVQMGIDRSLAHLLLTQTTQAPGAVTPATSGADNQPLAAPVNPLELAIKDIATVGMVAPKVAQAIVNKVAATAQVVSPANDIKNIEPTNVIATQAGIDNSSLMPAPTLSDEDLLKAKKVKLRTSSDSEQSHADHSVEALSSLMRLSQEAKFTPAISLPKANVSVTPESLAANSGTNISAGAESNLAGVSVTGDAFKLARASASNQPLVDMTQSMNVAAENTHTAVQVTAADAVQNSSVSMPDTLKAVDQNASMANKNPNIDQASFNVVSTTVIPGSNPAQGVSVSQPPPAILSQDWLRSMGAQSALAAPTTPTASAEVAAGTSITKDGTVNSMAGVNAVLSVQKTELQGAGKPSALARATRATDQTVLPNTLHNVTLDPALITAPLHISKPAILPDMGASSLAQATGQWANLRLGDQVNGSQSADTSARPTDPAAQAILNTPIELPRPDKSYETRMEEFSSQVASRLLAQVKTEKYAVNLKVTPENLGPISISLNVDGNNLNAHFGAAVPEVRALLQAALPSLKSNLESAGFNLGNTTFSQSGQGSGSAFANQSGSNPQPMRTPSQANLLKPTPEEGAGVAVSSGNSPHVLDVYA
jgi:flagellar hook-length control protein FliK